MAQIQPASARAPANKAGVKAQRRGSKNSRVQKGVRKASKNLPLSKDLLKTMFELMVKSRVLEERQIKIYKAGESFFWIGAPGEEAWGVPLGLLVNKGHGIQHDFLHLHYRCTPTLVAMGMSMIDSIRLIMSRATDPSSGGRNFSNHYCFPQWNVVPVSSPIEVQYSMALGTARVQQRRKAKGITIVSGGDAGTAEGDFASCLVWASRPKNELPMLITVQNNRWGISTNYESQHGETHITDRAKAFRMRTAVINGNDPVETYLQLKELLTYVREKRKPAMVEAKVSRLYGHSSASGANLVVEEDCLQVFTSKLLSAGVIRENEVKELWARFENEARQAQEQVRLEPEPTAESVWDHTYVNGENADWRKF